MDENNALVEISKAQQALERASDINEIIDLRDRFMGLQVIANAKGMKDAAQEAKVYQLKAERKAGAWLAENVDHKGGNPQLFQDGIAQGLPEGVGIKESYRWQLENSLPEEIFNEWVDDSIATGREVTAKAIQFLAKEYQHKQKRKDMAAQVVDLPIESSVATGDFREIMKEMPPDSIDMIFTDPPYDEKSIPLYGDMARLAARVLKPGGSLITYVGHYAIIQAGNLMNEHLRFWWTIAVKHTGNSARLPGKWVYVEWKPMLWYVKGGRNNNNNFVADFIESKPPDKDAHDWQQDVTEAEYYINNLTVPGAIVLDPFCGSGTTLIAALNIGRQSIGIEIDEERANVCRQRIANQCR